MVVLAVRLIDLFRVTRRLKALVAVIADLLLRQLFGSVLFFLGYLNLAFFDNPSA
jgi:hypothetical protein